MEHVGKHGMFSTVFLNIKIPSGNQAWLARDVYSWENHLPMVDFPLGIFITYILVGGLVVWWFGCHEFYFPINIGNVIIPIDFHIFQRGGEKPPTSIDFHSFGKWLMIDCDLKNVKLPEIVCLQIFIGCVEN